VLTVKAGIFKDRPLPDPQFEAQNWNTVTAHKGTEVAAGNLCHERFYDPLMMITNTNEWAEGEDGSLREADETVGLILDTRTAITKIPTHVTRRYKRIALIEKPNSVNRRPSSSCRKGSSRKATFKLTKTDSTLSYPDDCELDSGRPPTYS
jgi:hypothetical protein